MLGLKDDPSFLQNFYYLGYHSVFFVINIGSMLFGIIFYVGSLIFILITRNVKHQRVQSIRKRLKNELMWNSILSFIKESLIIFCVACCLQYKNFKFETAG